MNDEQPTGHQSPITNHQSRITNNQSRLANIAIFASGGGSNARKIIEYFKQSEVAQVVLVVSNKPKAGVLDIAAEHGIPTQIIDRQGFYETEAILGVLKEYSVDFIALAGFLWLVPGYLVRAFPGRVVNIHPALLPKYGGKGMYGHHVHEAVKAAGETETGMTIHLVNEHYDEGDIVFQASCPVAPEDTPEDIARKVLVLEHQFFPETIEKLIMGK
jgi:phosphoribosylglycinamide formyltransferase-1